MNITRIIAILLPILIAIFAGKKSAKKVDEPTDKKMNSHRSNEELMNEITKNPNDIRAIYYNGYQLWQSGKTREGLNYLLKREDQFRNKEAMYTLIAEMYNDDSAPRKAIEFYEKSIRIEPTSFAHTRVAEIYDQYADYDKAIKHYKSALNYQGAEKIYLYNRISRAYMYMGNDKMADKYREKSEKSKDVSTNRVSYHFSPEDLVGPRRSQKKSRSGLLVFIIIIMLVFGIFSVILSVSNDYDDFDLEVLESAAGDLLSSEDSVDASTQALPDDSATEEATTVVSGNAFVSIDPVDSETLLANIGNSNSNIYYGAEVVEIASGQYAGQVIEQDTDGIYRWNPEDDLVTYITDEADASQFNELNETLYYVTNSDDLTSSTIHGIDFNGNEFLALEGDVVVNLLVDNNNLYYINQTTDSTQLVVYTFETQNERAYDLDDVTMISQNMDYIMYLSNGSMYLISKSNLAMGQFDDDYTLPLLEEDWIDFAVLDNTKIFYVSEYDSGLSMYDLTDNTTTRILPEFDISSMDLNVFKDYLYVGYYDADSDLDKTGVYDFTGQEMTTYDDYWANVITTNYLYYSSNYPGYY